MHLRTLLTTVLLYGTLAAAAQEQPSARGSLKRGSAHLFLRFSGDWHLNGADKINDQKSRYDGLETPNKLGGGLGIEFQRLTRSRFMISGGLMLKLAPQEYRIRYNPQEVGFSGGTLYQATENYTCMYSSVALHAGYSALLSPRAAFDVDAGFNILLALNTAKGEELYYDQISSPMYNDLVLYRNTVWGSTDATPKFVGSIRAAFRGYQGLLFRDRSFRIGLEGCMLPSNDRYTTANNRSELRFYGANREPLGRQFFFDRHLSLSLFVDIEL